MIISISKTSKDVRVNSIPGCKMQNGLGVSGSWWDGDWNSGGNLWLASRDPSHQTVLGLCQNPQKDEINAT